MTAFSHSYVTRVLLATRRAAYGFDPAFRRRAGLEPLSTHTGPSCTICGGLDLNGERSMGSADRSNLGCFGNSAFRRAGTVRADVRAGRHPGVDRRKAGS